jgi:type I restriction enzyme R subunit
VRRAIAEIVKVAGNTSLNLYDRNREVYEPAALRREGQARRRRADRDRLAHRLEAPRAQPLRDRRGGHGQGGRRQGRTKRPDIVLYVNGIALGVLELKRSSVSVSEGIRQNLDNQKKEFIQPFFSTMQYVMAGNDTEGLRYGTIQTPEKYYLTWKEAGLPATTRSTKALRQLCARRASSSSSTTSSCSTPAPRSSAATTSTSACAPPSSHVRRREGGIIWHTQGSGKSLTMVWLAKWIRENVKDARVLIITDRTELDEQIEKVFNGVARTSTARSRAPT